MIVIKSSVAEKKYNFFFKTLLISFFTISLITSCSKKSDTQAPVINTVLPTVTTSPISSYSSTSAIGGGNVSSDGGSIVRRRGVVWSTKPNPDTTLSTRTYDKTGTGIFTSNITGLSMDSTYYVRAYAVNSAGVAYGAQISFSARDVYVAGMVYNGSYMVATIWKNGVATFLAEGSHYSEANSVFVSGSDVYVAGTEIKGALGDTKPVATIWKNGVAIPLTDSSHTSEAYSVFVSGSDVYVGGTENSINNYDTIRYATIWKNGVAISISDSTNYDEVQSVYVSGTDVYATGFEGLLGSSLPMYAKVWKNGVANYLTSGNKSSNAQSVFVSGPDVYVAGYEQDNGFGQTYATLWKNGVPTTLPDAANATTAISVFVSGKDVFAIGENAPIIWKNGVENTTWATNDNNIVNHFKSIFVTGTDVYVVGSYYDFGLRNNFATIWKNGKATLLTDSSTYAEATSVFVK